jgi:hypothetical protein
VSEKTPEKIVAENPDVSNPLKIFCKNKNLKK